MWIRGSSILALGSFVVACGEDPERDPYLPTGDGGAASDGTVEDACLGDALPDELRVDDDAAAATQGQATHLVAVGQRFVACGDGFVDVWDPEDEAMSNGASLGGRCRGLAPAGNGSFVAVTDGELVVFDLGPNGLAEAGRTSVAGSVGGVASDGTLAWVAAGSSGVQVFDVSTGTPSPQGAWPVADARDVALSQAGVVVAAGAGGVELFSTDGVSQGVAATDTPAEGVRAGDVAAAVLRGSFGWDLVDLSGGAPSIVASQETGGVVLDAAVSDAEVLTAEAHALVRWDTSETPRISSVEPRADFGALDGAWIRAVARSSEAAAILGDDSVARLRIERMEDGPRLEVDVPSMSLWSNGAPMAEGLYVIRNAGDGPLHLRAVYGSDPLEVALDERLLEPSEDCEGQSVIEPGGSATISVSYVATGAPFSATLTIETDDPDALVFEVPVEGDQPGPQPGDVVEDFSVPTLDGGTFRLSDHAGKVVFIKLFNFACSTCAEEFPVIEADLAARYPSSDVVLLGLNTAHRTAYAADLAASSALTFPIGLDLDSEVFRRLRIPGAVFPLHVVIGRDGRVGWVSNDKGVEPIAAAIDAAL